MSPFVESIQRLILRDLNRVETEILIFPTEESLWLTKGQVINSAGNLCLHLCGNLRHYIGYRLGNSSYQRNREAEFSVRYITKEQLKITLQQAREELVSAFAMLREEEMDGIYPEKVLQEPTTTRFFLIHLAGHLNYHLGQINYLRRVL